MTKYSFDVVGYTYRGESLCRPCTYASLFADVDPWVGAESEMNRLAATLGIDRGDETTYDSDDFPKVIFRDTTHDGHADPCDACGADLSTGEEVTYRECPSCGGAVPLTSEMAAAWSRVTCPDCGEERAPALLPEDGSCSVWVDTESGTWGAAAGTLAVVTLLPGLDLASLSDAEVCAWARESVSEGRGTYAC